MKALLLNVKENNYKVVDIKDNLDTYYNLIGCDCIDIVMRKIGGKYFDIVCDDEGLLKSEPKISAISNTYEPMLVGNLVIVHNDGMGNLVGITDSDIEHLKKNIKYMSTLRYLTPYPMLVNCEY